MEKKKRTKKIEVWGFLSEDLDTIIFIQRTREEMADKLKNKKELTRVRKITMTYEK